MTAVVRVIPTAFAGRLLQAFVEVVFAVVVLSGSVVVGHHLKAWHEWYGDPTTAHPWAPTPKPSAAPDAPEWPGFWSQP